MTRTRSSTARAILLASAAALAAGGIAIAAPGDLSLVSVSSGGALGTTAVEAGGVSADGRHVAFTSASALTATPTGGVVQLYVRDRTTGTTTLASASAAGAAANGAVDADDAGNPAFAISGDGRYVVFASVATNLTPADTDAGKDVYRKDLTTGAVTLISVNGAGTKANAAVFGDPDISGDGNRVSFGSGNATNLITPDANAGNSDILVRDVAAGTTVLAAQTTAGVQANGITDRSAISADGRVVAFEAPLATDNLAANDSGGGNDVFARNLAAGTLAPASDPTVANGATFPDISGDGRYVVFETSQKYDPVNDVSGGNDAYRRDMGTTAFILASAKNASDVGGGTDGTRPVISADGNRVAFTSASTDLTTDANAATKDVFVRDVTARTTTLASANGATQGATDSDRPAIAPNGALATFVFTDGATRLVSGDTNTQPDLHAKQFAPTDATGPALTLTGPAEGASQSAERIAVGGTATDPSGIVSVTVGGTALPLTATGGFSTTVALTVGANAITVVARDGAGNTTTATRTVTRTAPVVSKPGPRARVLALSASLTKAGAVRVALRLSARARVRVTLLRRTVRTGPRRVVLRRIGAPLTRSLTAGRRAIVFTPARRLPAGRYVVRVRFLTPVSGPVTRAAAFRVVRR